MKKLMSWLILILLLTGNATAGETLPPLKNGKSPQTLNEVWGNYDPAAEPMEVETIKEWEEEGVIIRAIRYYIGTFKGKKAWMAGLYAFPKGGKNLPAILQSHGGGGSASSQKCIDFAKRGYAIFSLSWRVEPKYLKNYDLPPEAQTDWGGVTGDQIAEARGIKPSGDLNLDPVPSGRNDGYFLRTLAARRGITFLAQQPEVNPDKIGMTGHSMGGVNTHQTTAMEPVRIKASAPSDGPPIEHLHKTHKNTPRTEEDRKILDLTRRTAVPALYAEKITVPMLFMNSINDFHGHAEDVEWIIDNMEAKDYRLVRTPHANHWHSPAARAAQFLWFDTYLKGTFDFPQRPEIKLELKTSDRKPLATVIPDPATKLVLDSVDVYYTRDGDNDFHGGYQSQIWGYVKGEKKGNSYTAKIPVIRREAPLWVYANVNCKLPENNDYYKFPEETETLLCSTRMIMISYKDLLAAGVKFIPVDSTLIIDDFGSNWQKEWAYMGRNSGFVSFKLLKPNLHIPERAKLVFKIQSKGKNGGRISIDDYSAVFKLQPGENIVELYPFQFEHRDNKNSLLDWRITLDNRPPIKFRIKDGPSFQPRELAFVELTQEEFNAKRDRLAKVKRIDGKIPLTFQLADQVIIKQGRAPKKLPVFTASIEKKTPDYETGLMIRSPSEIIYFLNNNFTRFKAIGAPYHKGSVAYEVWADGKKLFKSPRINSKSQPVEIDVDITDRQELKLIVTGRGMAMWANPTLE